MLVCCNTAERSIVAPAPGVRSRAKRAVFSLCNATLRWQFDRTTSFTSITRATPTVLPCHSLLILACATFSCSGGQARRLCGYRRYLRGDRCIFSQHGPFPVEQRGRVGLSAEIESNALILRIGSFNCRRSHATMRRLVSICNCTR